jgi:hypothetical protein
MSGCILLTGTEADDFQKQQQQQQQQQQQRGGGGGGNVPRSVTLS